MVVETPQNHESALATPTTGLVIDGVALVRGMRVIQPALSHVIAPGRMSLLTGPNGSGKSTLLRAIGGRLRPMAGRISCAAPIIYVGHADGLAATLSGRRNLRDWAGLNGLPVDAPGDAGMIDTALAALAAGPFADLPVRMLSRGQRRRLALARLALSPRGALWLLDEPAAGLDRAAQADLDRLITAHLDRGGMVMAATHTPLGSGHDHDELALEAYP